MPAKPKLKFVGHVIEASCTEDRIGSRRSILPAIKYDDFEHLPAIRSATIAPLFSSSSQRRMQFNNLNTRYTNDFCVKSVLFMQNVS